MRDFRPNFSSKLKAMPRVSAALFAAAVLSLGGLTVRPAAADEALPEILQYFDIAERTANSPRIDNYDETWMITGPVSDSVSQATKGENWTLLEGKIVYSYYKFAPGDSALQIARGLEAFAKEKGYETVFACVSDRQDCFLKESSAPGLSIGILLDEPRNMPALDEQKMSYVRNYFMSDRGRLFYFTRTKGEAVEHVQIALADSASKGVMAITKTVIIGEMPDLTGANSMRDALAAGQSVNLDNLLFDTNSAILLPNSLDQLQEIAMMLRDDPALKLQIIGHTDSDGGKAHNQDLSERRAAAVVEALVKGFDIAGERLTSAGRGMDEPIASNDSKEGKAKNRRVELKIQ